MLVKNDLFDYENRYIYQDSDFFKFSLDSILLAEYVKVNNKAKIIVDMCAGNMAIPLILSKYTTKPIVGFEIQDKVYKLGKKSIEINQLENQLTIVNSDVNSLGDYYKKESIDILICNPPFFKLSNTKVVNDINEKSLARHEISLTLENIFALAKRHLISQGNLFLVHRTDRLDEIMNLGYKYQVNVKEIQFISTKQGKNPKIVLVHCIKNSKSGVKVKHELCIENVKTYQNIFREES